MSIEARVRSIIADQLGISIKTVETQMGKALRLMRTALADYLVTLIGISGLIKVGAGLLGLLIDCISIV